MNLIVLSLILGLVVDFQDLTIVYLACSRLRFIGNSPTMHNSGSIISFILLARRIRMTFVTFNQDIFRVAPAASVPPQALVMP